MFQKEYPNDCLHLLKQYDAQCVFKSGAQQLHIAASDLAVLEMSAQLKNAASKKRTLMDQHVQIKKPRRDVESGANGGKSGDDSEDEAETLVIQVMVQPFLLSYMVLHFV
jgi:hypothetical protein